MPKYMGESDILTDPGRSRYDDGMGIFSKSDEQRADNDRHAALKKAQSNYRNKSGKEDATYRQLNAARAENERNVSWWRR